MLNKYVYAIDDVDNDKILVKSVVASSYQDAQEKIMKAVCDYFNEENTYTDFDEFKYNYTVSDPYDIEEL